MNSIHLGESNWVKKVGEKLLRITLQGRRNPWAGWCALSILNFYISTYKKNIFFQFKSKKIDFLDNSFYKKWDCQVSTQIREQMSGPEIS